MTLLEIKLNSLALTGVFKSSITFKSIALTVIEVTPENIEFIDDWKAIGLFNFAFLISTTNRGGLSITNTRCFTGSDTVNINLF